MRRKYLTKFHHNIRITAHQRQPLRSIIKLGSLTISLLLLTACHPIPRPDDVVMVSRPLPAQPIQAAKLPKDVDSNDTTDTRKKTANTDETKITHHTTALPNHAISTSKQHPMILTLTDAIALAMRHNLSLKSDELDRIVQKYDVILQQYNFDPQLRLTGDYTYTRDIADSIGTPTREATLNPAISLRNHHGTLVKVTQDNSYQYDHPSNASPFGPGTNSHGVTTEITQSLLRGFGKDVVDAALNNAKDSERINQLSFTNSVNSTITTVISNYFSLVEAYQTLQVDQESLEGYEQLIKIDQLKIKSGRIPASDIIDLKSSLASTKVSIESDKNNIANARRILLNSIGLESYTPFTLPSFEQELSYDEKILSVNGSTLNRENSFKYALQHNTDYQTAGIEILLAQRDVTVAKNNELPELDFSLTHSFDFKDSSDINNNSDLTAKLTYDQPINDVTLKSQTVSAQVALQKSIIALKQARRDLYNTINDDIDNIESRKKQIVLGQEAVKLQQRNYNIARQKYNHGLTSNYDVTEVEQRLISDQITLIDARISYLEGLAAFAQDINMSLQLWHIKVVAGSDFAETLRRLNHETMQ